MENEIISKKQKSQLLNGNAIKKIRRTIGLTQHQMCKLLNMSNHGNYSRLESGMLAFSKVHFDKTVGMFERWKHEKILELEGKITEIKGISFEFTNSK